MVIRADPRAQRGAAVQRVVDDLLTVHPEVDGPPHVRVVERREAGVEDAVGVPTGQHLNGVHFVAEAVLDVLGLVRRRVRSEVNVLRLKGGHFRRLRQLHLGDAVQVGQALNPEVVVLHVLHGNTPLPRVVVEDERAGAIGVVAEKVQALGDVVAGEHGRPVGTELGQEDGRRLCDGYGNGVAVHDSRDRLVGPNQAAAGRRHVTGVRVEVHASLHVRGVKVRSIVELDALYEREGVGAAIVRQLPGLNHVGLDLTRDRVGPRAPVLEEKGVIDQVPELEDRGVRVVNHLQ